MIDILEWARDVGAPMLTVIALSYYILGIQQPRQVRALIAIIQRQSRHLTRVEDRQEAMDTVMISSHPDPVALYTRLIAEKQAERTEQEKSDPLVPFPSYNDIKLPGLGRTK